MDEHITIIITDDGLYSKWVGAELVNAFDMENTMMISYLLRNRRTLTTTVMLGKPEDFNVAVYVEAMSSEGRAPVIVMIMSKELYGKTEHPETEQDTLHRLSHLIENNHFSVCLEDEEDYDDDVEPVAQVLKLVPPLTDKSSN